MAKVIVPKNYIYNHDTVTAGKNLSTLFTSPLTLQYSGTFMYEDGVLCNDISINYSLGSSTSSAIGGSQTITIQNNSDLVGRCLIIDITNLPEFQNTSTSSTRTVNLVFNHNGTAIRLKQVSISTSTTAANTYGATTSLNGKYYVNLLTNTATQSAITSECCKAVVPQNWIYSSQANISLAYNEFTHTVSLSSTTISNISIPKYLGYAVKITWEGVPTNELGQYDLSKVPEYSNVTITLNVSELSCRFVKLTLSNFPAMKNSSNIRVPCAVLVAFGTSGSTVQLNSTTISQSSSSTPSVSSSAWADGDYWIDLKTKTVVDPKKAITTF